MGRISPRCRNGWATRIFPPPGCMTEEDGDPRRARRLRSNTDRGAAHDVWGERETAYGPKCSQTIPCSVFDDRVSWLRTGVLTGYSVLGVCTCFSTTKRPRIDTT